ncbi:hypothetical protein [Nocardia otitidiscaviarum]|uniref:hypothetical protein n=1 Tax=Nocardia otitidiscaviarum TaxID=1823 RepID=UPI002458B0BE|nr:hypothetical protein [Nocardia otitidiscaviarum]
MCTCVFLLDDKAARFLAIESREQPVHRPHGFEAARRLGLHPRCSYGPHWHDNPELLQRIPASRIPNSDALADVVGGIDAEGGTWLAFNRRSGVYCRLLTTGTAAPAAVTTLPILCATAESARHAVHLVEELPPADTDTATLAYRLLIADGHDATVIAVDGPAVTTTALPPGVPHLLTTAEPTDGGALGKRLVDRLTRLPAPTGSLESWGPWLSVYTGADEPGPDYHSPAWTAYTYSAVQPPFITTATESHKTAAAFAAESPDEVEWTASVSLYAARPDGVELFAYNERQLFPYQPVPTEVARMGFPATPDDFFVPVAGAQH